MMVERKQFLLGRRLHDGRWFCDKFRTYIHQRRSKVNSEAELTIGETEILIRQRCMGASYSFHWGAFRQLCLVSLFVRIPM